MPGFFNEEKVLREAAIYSRGAFYVNNNRKLSDKYNRFYMDTRDSTKTKVRQKHMSIVRASEALNLKNSWLQSLP